MSRFTSSPFHKPAPFLFPSLPLSPPETSTDVGVTGHGTMANGVHSRHPSGGLTSTVAQEPTTSLPRRVSSIQYHNSPLRDSRERTPQRPHAHKSLLIVIPPNSLIHQHGQLGHSLASGPQHRLSQGVMMPLFPTMYGQLTAIAREFNFPSTVGLCLYLQFSEGGMMSTPRILDETWQLLWSHIFDSSSPSPTAGPFIAGRLEFDIDIQHARWYSAWISSLHRDQLDSVPSGFPFSAPGAVHVHAESRTSVRDDEYATDNTYPSRVGHVTRHVPRKLSLVERFDTRSDSKAPSRQTNSPHDQIPSAAHGLSPIFQEEEPKSARHELDQKILSWRNSAVLKPTPLAKMGQLSLEPANMPNDLPTAGTTESPIGNDFNLDDFHWSVTSLGPPDYDPVSPMSWEHPDSVHLAERLQGSVCLTPSFCTSFGPSDHTLSPLASSVSRFPSPDIAQRMFEDCPLTPGTCTSWGPASPISLAESISRVSSIDIANRMLFSRPVTPMTATSWGPSDRSWTPSEPGSEYARSVHLADRGLYSPLASPDFQPSTFFSSFGYTSQPNESLEDDTKLQTWPHSWPYSQPSAEEDAAGQSNGVTWQYSWPYSQYSQQRLSASEGATGQFNNMTWQHSWPYFQSPQQTLPINEAIVGQSMPWQHSWPYAQPQQPLPTGETSVGKSNSIIWQHSWPYSQASQQMIGDATSGQPRSTTWQHSWPYCRPSDFHSSVKRSFPTVVTAPSSYPRLNIYPAVYPHFEIYPAITGLTTDHESEQPPAYSPENLIYPPILSCKVVADEISMKRPQIIHTHQPRYPFFNIYPSVYPFFDIYPAVPGESIHYNSLQNDVAMDVGYTTSDISANLYFDSAETNTFSLISGVASSNYPFLMIYVPVYPHFDLYPTLIQMERPTQPITTKPYSVVYPYFDLYPSSAPKAEQHRSQTSVSNGGYPTFDIYPTVYPHFNLYPSAAAEPQAQGSFGSQISTGATHQLKENGPESLACVPTWNYSFFNIYRPVYPHFDLYPNLMVMEDRPKILGYKVSYPYFDIYPAVYPHFNLYPAFTVMEEQQPQNHTCLSVGQYPFFNIYPAVYPFFDLYPKAAAEIEHYKIGLLGTLSVSGIVMENTEEAAVSITSNSDRPKKSSRLTHSELHAMVMMERLSNDVQKPQRPPPQQHLSRRSAMFSRNNASHNNVGVASTSPSVMLDVVPKRSQSLRMRVPPLAQRNSSIYDQDVFEMVTPPILKEDDTSRPVSAFIGATSNRTDGLNFNANLVQGHPDQRQLVRPSHLVPRRSNSVVNQRVKAFDAAADKALGETISKFPMPPVYTKPKTLDKIKYPFM